MPSQILEKLRNRISGPLGHALINDRIDDVYLAAFPRSGSTWVRTVLVNIIEPGSNSNPDIFNAKIPAVSIRNAKLINALESPRQIMTHSTWRPKIKKAVYLIRDGRDAFISSYHYHVTRNGVDMSLEHFYELYRADVYGHTWHHHVHNWLTLGQENLQDNFHLVRFEELKEKPNAVIKSICDFMQIEVADTALADAIAKASIENARKIEQERQGPIVDKNASFYREGESKQWQRSEYANAIHDFVKNSEAALRLSQYI